MTRSGTDSDAGAVAPSGPLAGLRVLEVESIGPGPFAAMLLADLGASVMQVSRPGPAGKRNANAVLYRNRAGAVPLDLKSASGRAAMLELVAQADVLIEGYRPGVMERLGLGPEVCIESNARLVYGRVTGWGRSGPIAKTAGHDINYIALSGALHACGSAESGPMPPLNLVGDFGGGGLMLAFGIVSALFEVRQSGHGQVVDTAMLGGATSLMAMIYGMRAVGRWPAERAGNLFDGSAWFYTTYACADGRWVAVGAIELEFRRILLDKLGFGAEVETLLKRPEQDADLRARLAAAFAAQPRDHWQALFEATDACVTPVLAMDEIADHPQNQALDCVRRIDGVINPMPAPHFSRTPAAVPELKGRSELAALWRLPAAAAA